MVHHPQSSRQVLGVDVTAQAVMLILSVLTVGALVGWALLRWLERVA